MTELQLYKFISDNSIEYHWNDNGGINDVIIFVNNYHIEEWGKMLKGSSLLDEEGITCTMKDGYFCFWMTEICEHFGIIVTNIFTDLKA